MTNQSLILASNSPRRRELLAEIVADFEVVPCAYGEPELKSASVPAQQWAAAMAYFKARGVAERFPDRWVLGADTVVECAGRLLGKPRDVEDARLMLELQARTVSCVCTGVCLLRLNPRRRMSHVERTAVWMRDDPQERATYLASGDWQGKAGAYGIQTVGDRLVERLEGSLSNVVGLPLEALAQLLTEAGLRPKASPGVS